MYYTFSLAGPCKGSRDNTPSIISVVATIILNQPMSEGYHFSMNLIAVNHNTYKPNLYI